MDTAYTGNQIATRRKALGMTQKDLAEKLHVTDKAVSKWERGLNFPDLGLMESLAAVLETTPACLLGLEEANRDEIVSSMTQISGEQLEDSLRDVKWFGWGCVLAAALLTAVYFLYGKNVRHTQIAYMILYSVMTAAAVCGLWLLFKYGEIRKFRTGDTLTLYGAALPVLIHLGISFFTGHSPHPVMGLALIIIAACFTQLFFFRIMRPQPAKALPLILCAAFMALQFRFGNFIPEVIAPAVCCFLVWLICFLKTRKKEPIQYGRSQ